MIQFTQNRQDIPEVLQSTRYLREPLQVLPVEATSYRAGFRTRENQNAFHGTLIDARGWFQLAASHFDAELTFRAFFHQFWRGPARENTNSWRER